MSHLQKLIDQLCPDGVEYKKLGEVISLERGKRVVRKQLSETEGYPVYQNSLTPLGYYYQSNYPKNSTFIIVAGAAGEIGYSDEDFWAADDCFVIVCPENISSRYIYHFLLNRQQSLYSKVRKASIPRLPRQAIDNIKIPVPPMEVQREIVRILDEYTARTTELVKELEVELEARKKQYEFYRDQLLNFDDVRGGQTVDLQWKMLGELFPFIRNGFVGTVTPYFTNEKNGVRYIRGTNIHNGTLSDNEEVYVTPEFHKKHLRSELKADDILVVQSGHVGDCAVVGEKYQGANCHALIIMSNGGMCNSRYIVYYLHTREGKRKLAQISTGGTIKHILASTIKNVQIPVPPLAEQERIVAILDRFDALCNDLTSGLPAEIAARQKQYEYYRDRLLSFTIQSNKEE